MLELVHPGEGRTRLFAMLFLRRLPPAVRLQLTEDDHEDLSALAEKADHCAASIHHHQQSASQIFSATADNTPETEEQEEFSVAAGGAGHGGRGGQCGCSGQNRPRGGQNRPCPQQQQQFSASQPATDTPAQLARQASGLCRSHFHYGDKAYSCGSNCATVRGRETSCLERCSRHPPGQTGLPLGSAIRRPLLSRHRRYSLHHPWPYFLRRPGADRRKRQHNCHRCRADTPASLWPQQLLLSPFQL